MADCQSSTENGTELTSDDLVTRLRSIPTAQLANAAADEIERLWAMTAEQAQVHDAWLTERSLADKLADALADHMRGDDHPAYTAWEEARRG